MNKYFLLILSCLILTSCSKDDNVNDPNYLYEYSNDSELTITYYQNSYMKRGEVSQGDKVVFKYTYTAEDDKEIADDEYTEFIYFEIDSALDEFLLEGDALESANLILAKSCFCYFPYDSDKDVAPVGSISGEKLSDNTWKVNVDVMFYGEDTREFEATFISETLF